MCHPKFHAKWCPGPRSNDHVPKKWLRNGLSKSQQKWAKNSQKSWNGRPEGTFEGQTQLLPYISPPWYVVWEYARKKNWVMNKLSNSYSTALLRHLLMIGTGLSTIGDSIMHRSLCCAPTSSQDNLMKFGMCNHFTKKLRWTFKKNFETQKLRLITSLITVIRVINFWKYIFLIWYGSIIITTWTNMVSIATFRF